MFPEMQTAGQRLSRTFSPRSSLLRRQRDGGVAPVTVTTPLATTTGGNTQQSWSIGGSWTRLMFVHGCDEASQNLSRLTTNGWRNFRSVDWQRFHLPFERLQVRIQLTKNEPSGNPRQIPLRSRSEDGTARNQPAIRHSDCQPCRNSPGEGFHRLERSRLDSG